MTRRATTAPVTALDTDQVAWACFPGLTPDFGPLTGRPGGVAWDATDVRGQDAQARVLTRP